eukprot:CAMPEP_0173263554 /NCGR_PEP_ID=MMETSP1142-20121109/27444_1 /TAXON_ID=483371 /ORGANISM="non described non described, Strain CCMP2298" /LENGTH=117 /DNA_ID=CAMNT_0014198915 /DNA_START=576 /DNA_END=926 /DNA_ORIENTATION=+
MPRRGGALCCVPDRVRVEAKEPGLLGAMPSNSPTCCLSAAPPGYSVLPSGRLMRNVSKDEPPPSTPARASAASMRYTTKPSASEEVQLACTVESWETGLSSGSPVLDLGPMTRLTVT